jgi:hypothetical protein
MKHLTLWPRLPERESFTCFIDSFGTFFIATGFVSILMLGSPVRM